MNKSLIVLAPLLAVALTLPVAGWADRFPPEVASQSGDSLPAGKKIVEDADQDAEQVALIGLLQSQQRDGQREKSSSERDQTEYGWRVLYLLGGATVTAVASWGLRRFASHRDGRSKDEKQLKLRQRIALGPRGYAALLDVKGDEFLLVVSGEGIQIERLWSVDATKAEVGKEGEDRSFKCEKVIAL
jgi:flagellar biogenesis protein FliO